VMVMVLSIASMLALMTPTRRLLVFVAALNLQLALKLSATLSPMKHTAQPKQDLLVNGVEVGWPVVHALLKVAAV